MWSDATTIGGHVLAIRNNGTPTTADDTLWAWGANNSRQLGVLATDPLLSTPAQVKICRAAAGAIVSTTATIGAGSCAALGGTVKNLEGVTAAVVGSLNSYAIMSDRTLLAWGAGASGQLGDGSRVSIRPLPVQVGNLTGVIDVTTGGGAGLAVTHHDGGTVWGWGSNAYSILGDPAFPGISSFPDFVVLPTADSSHQDYHLASGAALILAGNASINGNITGNSSNVLVFGPGSVVKGQVTGIGHVHYGAHAHLKGNLEVASQIATFNGKGSLIEGHAAAGDATLKPLAETTVKGHLTIKMRLALEDGAALTVTGTLTCDPTASFSKASSATLTVQGAVRETCEK